MNCKHCNEKEYCTLFKKQITEGICKNCVMKLPRDYFNDIFGSFINKYSNGGEWYK